MSHWGFVVLSSCDGSAFRVFPTGPSLWQGSLTWSSAANTLSSPGPYVVSSGAATQNVSVNFPAVNLKSSGLGVTFTPTQIGVVRACYSGTFGLAPSGTAMQEMVDGSGNVLAPMLWAQATQSTFYQCGYLNVTAVGSAVSVEIYGAELGGTGTISQLSGFNSLTLEYVH